MRVAARQPPGPRFLSDAFSVRFLPGIIPIALSPPILLLGRRIVAVTVIVSCPNHRTMAVAVLVRSLSHYPSASLPPINRALRRHLLACCQYARNPRHRDDFDATEGERGSDLPHHS